MQTRPDSDEDPISLKKGCPSCEMSRSVPLVHRPGHAQADLGEAIGSSVASVAPRGVTDPPTRSLHP